MSELAKRRAKAIRLSNEEAQEHAKEIKRVSLIVQNLRLRLRQIHPFYGTALLMLHDVVPTLKCSTAATDGLLIMYNPKFTVDKTQAELNFVMMHELFHVLLGHTRRIGTGNHQLWNLAEDAVINWELYNMSTSLNSHDKLNLKLQGGCVLLKENGNPYDVSKVTSAILYNTAEIKELNHEEFMQEMYKKVDEMERCDPEFNKASVIPILSCYEVAGTTGKLIRLKYGDGVFSWVEPTDVSDEFKQKFGDSNDVKSDDSNENGSINESNSGASDNGKNGIPEMTSQEADEARKEIENIILRARDEAVRQQSMHGHGEGSLADWIIDSLKPSRVKWSTYLKRYLTAHEGSDTSWVTPERKYLCHGYILPGESEEEHLENAWFFIDQSGSIRDEELQTFLEQAYTICKNFSCRINVAYWDTEVGEPYKEIDEPKKVADAKPTGSGGTDINCVFEYVRERKSAFKESVIIICTDGYCGYEEHLESWIRKMTIIALSDDSSDDVEELAKNGKLVDLY